MGPRIRLCFWFVPRILPAVACARFDTRANGGILEEKDLIIIGGGVAGYIAAIKAGQEGMKVRRKL